MRLKKSEVLDILALKLELAKEWDKQILAKHKDDEREWAKNVAVALKTMLDTVKKAKTPAEIRRCIRPGGRYGWDAIGGEPPTCPISQVVAIQRVLDFIARDGRKTYSVSDVGNLRLLHGALTWNPTPTKTELC